MNIFELSAKIELDTKQYRAEIKSAENAQAQFNRNLQNVANQTEAVKNKVSMLSAQYANARNNVSRLTVAFNESAAKTGVMSAETQRLAKELDDAQREADQLKGSLDSYSASTAKAAMNTDSDTQSMSNSWSGFGTTVLGIVTGIVAAVGAGFAKLTQIGTSYNAEIESYITNFRVMLGDAESATAKVEQLRDMAAQTPFGLSDIASATQTMLGFGIEAENTEEILQRLGDASLGDAQKLQSLTLAFSQATSSGKLMGQDLLQMINAGFNPLQQITEATGLSVGQLKEIMGGASEEALEAMKNLEGVTDYGRQIIEQGYISAQDLYTALRLATSEGGQFFNGMAEASQTVGGLFSTLTDDARDLIGGFFTPLSNFLKSDLLPDAIEIVADIKNLLEGGDASALADRIGGIFGKIGGFIKDNAEGFASIGIDLFLAIINGATSGIDALVEPMVDTINTVVSKLSDNTPRLMQAGGKLLGTLISAIVVLAKNGAQLFSQFVPVIISALPGLFEELAGATDWAMLIDALMIPFIGLLITELPRITEAISDALPAIINAIVVDLGNEFPGVVDAFVDGVWSLVSSGVQAIGSVVKNMIPAIFESVVELIRGYFGIVFGNLEGIANKLNLGGVSEWLSGARDYVNSIENPFAFNASESGVYENVVGERATPAGNSTTIGDVKVEVNVPNTNASPQEIGDAVAEALSIELYEVSDRKAAAYGKTYPLAR